MFKLNSKKYILGLLFVLIHLVNLGQSVINGSINGVSTGYNMFATVYGWNNCSIAPGLTNNTPDVCNVSFPSWNSFSTVTPINSPDGGNWVGIAQGINPPESECIVGNVIGIINGNSYVLNFYGACFGTGVGSYGNGNLPVLQINIGSTTNTISIPMTDSEWFNYCVQFKATSSNMNFTIRNIAGGGYASLDGFDVSPSPIQDKNNNTTLCDGETITLNATTANATYLWQDNSTTPNFNVTQTGTYMVTVTVNNCIMTDTIVIDSKKCASTIEMPNVFTPNNDGSNDYFSLIKKHNINNTNISIYNRWGQKIFENENISWNGKSNETDCSEGIYFWVIRYTDINGKENNLSGFVTLLR